MSMEATHGSVDPVLQAAEMQRSGVDSPEHLDRLLKRWIAFASEHPRSAGIFRDIAREVAERYKDWEPNQDSQNNADLEQRKSMQLFIAGFTVGLMLQDNVASLADLEEQLRSLDSSEPVDL